MPDTWQMQAVSCSKCGHRLGGRPVRCIYCGATVATADAPARPCPRCRESMTVEPARWVLIDRCGHCKGEFFDNFEVERALNLDDARIRRLHELETPVPADTPDRSPLPCPACAKAMKTWRLSGSPPLQIDRCPGCKGIWLDAGEGARLGRLLEPPPPHVAIAPSTAGADLTRAVHYRHYHHSGPDLVDVGCALLDLFVDLD